MKQFDLFLDPPTGNTTVPRVAKSACIEPFDFELDGDAARCVPLDGAVIPEEIRLPTDDENWMPEKA